MLSMDKLPAVAKIKAKNNATGHTINTPKNDEISEIYLQSFILYKKSPEAFISAKRNDKRSIV